MAKMITLKSSDGEVFEVDEAVAMESQTIKHMIEDDCAENGIPLPNVTSKILAKVIEYCRKHVDASAAAASKSSDDSSKLADEELKSWDSEFVKVDQATLFDLILVRSLTDSLGIVVSMGNPLTCASIVDNKNIHVVPWGMSLVLVTGTRTARYRAVPSKIDHRRSISAVGGRLKKKSTVDGRLRKKKGRRIGKEKKKKRGIKNTSPTCRRRPRVARSRFFSRSRRWSVSPRGETKYSGGTYCAYRPVRVPYWY
ncbi:hypothetical protein BHM03_00057286 [Ensete ventricosum]|nr:hypothetical protein BHM03_00057286 [Ensete ventricosum]